MGMSNLAMLTSFGQLSGGVFQLWRTEFYALNFIGHALNGGLSAPCGCYQQSCGAFKYCSAVSATTQFCLSAYLSALLAAHYNGSCLDHQSQH